MSCGGQSTVGLLSIEGVCTDVHAGGTSYKTYNLSCAYLRSAENQI